MKILLALVLSAVVAAASEAAERDAGISNAEAKRIVRKTFASVCGNDYQFRCPYALEDRPRCPFEAIVLLPLGEDGTYDGRSRAVWVALSAKGRVLRIADNRADVCPPRPAA